MVTYPTKWLHLVAFAGVLGIGQANGQPATVEAVANYGGADRQKVLEDGARREGNLLLYTTGTQIKPLLDPQWKGRMAISGLTTTAVNWVGSMVIAHGTDFVRRLGQQNIRIYNLTGRALANLMTAGEVVLSPTIYNSHVAASADKGAPLSWHAPGPVPVTDTGVAIARKAPHPHAAMLLVDFLMSKEGQSLY